MAMRAEVESALKSHEKSKSAILSWVLKPNPKRGLELRPARRAINQAGEYPSPMENPGLDPSSVL